jgi:adenylate cyclase
MVLSIFIKNNEQQIETIMVRSILVALQINEVPIKTLCGGKAICGKCLIRILKGRQYLSPVQPREAAALQRLGADPDMRLACQSYPGKDIEIEIINYGSG